MCLIGGHTSWFSRSPFQPFGALGEDSGVFFTYAQGSYSGCKRWGAHLFLPTTYTASYWIPGSKMTDFCFPQAEEGMVAVKQRKRCAPKGCTSSRRTS